MAVSGLVIALSTAGPALAIGEVGDGPAIATVKLDGSQGKRPSLRAELDLLDPFGLGSTVLVSGRATLHHSTLGMPMPFDAPTWASDGSKLIYTGASGKRNQIFTVGISDGRPRPVPKTVGGSNPVLSADGSRMAFARTREWTHIDPKHFKFKAYESTSAWLLDLTTRRVRRLTPWRNGLDYEPSSFSPDDSMLLLSRSNNHDHDVVAMRLDDGRLSTLAKEAEQGVYSPDGSRIAFISYRDRIVIGRGEDALLASELYSMGPDGTDLKRLTHSRRASESAPSWDPSGQRLAFVRSPASSGLAVLFPFGNRLMEINSDGTCARFLFNVPKQHRRQPAYYGAAWRPGPGREAGPISC